MTLVKTIKKNTDTILFTTPSHSGKFVILNKFKHFYECDISETDTHNPQEALLLSEKKAAQIYKTKSTSYLINGSTSGIIAAVLTSTQNGENVLIWDKAHISHRNAVILAGANPVFYSLEKDEKWGIYKNVSASLIEEKLSQNDIKTVIVTSPSYEGITCDVRAIKTVCERYGAYLIVDEAHGALYPFSDKLPESAISQGADFVIHSLHKTAGGLNPTALLHNNTNLDEKKALSLISTTSPSYPLLASIEKNINFLNSKKGRNALEEVLNLITELKKETYPNIEFCDFNDPTKILIKHVSYSGEELSEQLFRLKIEDERSNNVSVMLLCGIGSDKRKFNRLQKVLKKL